MGMRGVKECGWRMGEWHSENMWIPQWNHCQHFQESWKKKEIEHWSKCFLCKRELGTASELTPQQQPVGGSAPPPAASQHAHSAVNSLLHNCLGAWSAVATQERSVVVSGKMSKEESKLELWEALQMQRHSFNFWGCSAKLVVFPCIAVEQKPVKLSLTWRWGVCSVEVSKHLVPAHHALQRVKTPAPSHRRIGFFESAVQMKEPKLWIASEFFFGSVNENRKWRSSGQQLLLENLQLSRSVWLASPAVWPSTHSARSCCSALGTSQQQGSLKILKKKLIWSANEHLVVACMAWGCKVVLCVGSVGPPQLQLLNQAQRWKFCSGCKRCGSALQTPHCKFKNESIVDHQMSHWLFSVMMLMMIDGATAGCPFWGVNCDFWRENEDSANGRDASVCPPVCFPFGTLLFRGRWWFLGITRSWLNKSVGAPASVHSQVRRYVLTVSAYVPAS